MLLTAGMALVLSIVLTPPAMHLLRRLRSVDVPNERSSHTQCDGAANPVARSIPWARRTY